jgi:linoleoyl-CoA desaturase
MVYFSLFICIPVFIFGFWKALLGYILVSFVCGLALGIVFQLAHVVEGTQFPVVGDSNKVGNDWTIHQLSTTANFATGSKVLSWLLGGLNFQVEHHLFPRISHVHYPALSKRVKEVCSEFGVKYIEYKTIFQAIRSHISYLKTVGAE